MTVTKVRLFDAQRELVLGGRLHPRHREIVVHSVDLGSPTVREVTEPRFADSGSVDTTRLHGGRTVAMEATVYDPGLARELGTWLSPAARPRLGITDDTVHGGQERFVVLRRNDFTPGPITHLTHLRRKIQFQWSCPSGLIEGTDPVTMTVSAETGQVIGRTYPLTYPRSYPPGQPRGRVGHTNPGSESVHQVAWLYGPCRGPRWTCDTTGETLTFTSELVIPAGDYVEINTLERTARYLSDPAASRTHLIDHQVSSWWKIPTGPSEVRYHPASEVDAGCAATVAYRPAWLDE